MGDDGIFITRVLHTSDMTIAAGGPRLASGGLHKGFVLEGGLLHGHGLLHHPHVHVVREAGLVGRARDAEGGSAGHLHVDRLLHRRRGGGGGGGG